MPKGYHGKLIDVNLTTEDIKIVDYGESIFRNWLGGRGLGTYILWKELGDKWSDIDPLGEENLLLVLTGPLTGYYPGVKTAVTGKSPESNGVVGSVLSSEVGVYLKASGYDGIIIRGRAEKPKYLFVYNDHIELRDATKYWGRQGVDFLKELTKEAMELIGSIEKRKGVPREPAIMYIGVGGERKVRFASIMTKLFHAAGYGGYGAVMGSKNLKAIVVGGSGSLPPVSDYEKFLEMLKDSHARLLKATTFRNWGTGAGGYSVGAVTSSEPIRNWQEEWHDRSEISVVNFENRVWVKRFWGDYGCPVTCMKISRVLSGKYRGAMSDAPDYELMAYMGTNLGIFEPKDIVYLSSLVDDYGLDGINAGNVLGFAAELYQRNILTKEDLNGIELEWGNTDAFAKLLEMIVNREGIGDILAEGTYRAAKKISEEKGVDVMKYAVQVKGIGVGAHGVRSGMDYTGPISYTVSVQGGDHTSTASLPAISPRGELRSIFLDSAVICSFTAWIDLEYLIEFTNVVTGWNITLEEWLNNIGLRILHLQRILLLLGGPDVYWDPRVHDENPPRFYEPLPSGPKKGLAPKPEEVKEMVKQYYSEVGYDENGIPKEEILEKLGLSEAKMAVKKIKERLGLL